MRRIRSIGAYAVSLSTLRSPVLVDHFSKFIALDMSREVTPLFSLGARLRRLINSFFHFFSAVALAFILDRKRFPENGASVKIDGK